MNEYIYWRHSNETKKILNEIDQQITSISDNLADGTLLASIDNDKLSREYAYNVGFVDGLKFLTTLIDQKEEEPDESNT